MNEQDKKEFLEQFSYLDRIDGEYDTALTVQLLGWIEALVAKRVDEAKRRAFEDGREFQRRLHLDQRTKYIPVWW